MAQTSSLFGHPVFGPVATAPKSGFFKYGCALFDALEDSGPHSPATAKTRAMSDRERIQKLSRRLREIERREVASWQRPILEVAREALLAEISALARSVARWDKMFRKPVMASNC